MKKTIYIFEDKNSSPISRLLIQNCCYGCNFYFSEGASGLAKALCKQYKKDDFFIVFIDLVPNNQATFKYYNDLKQIIDDLEYQNVVLVPIICMEYVVLKVLVKYYQYQARSSHAILMEHLIKEFNWSDIPIGLKLREDGKEYSLEKLCKQLLNNSIPSCMKTDKGSKYFYTMNQQECPETDEMLDQRKRCGTACGRLKERAERVFAQLPLSEMAAEGSFYCLSEKSCIWVQKVSEALQQTDAFYLELFRQMGCRKTIDFTDQFVSSIL